MISTIPIGTFASLHPELLLRVDTLSEESLALGVVINGWVYLVDDNDGWEGFVSLVGLQNACNKLTDPDAQEFWDYLDAIEVDEACAEGQALCPTMEEESVLQAWFVEGEGECPVDINTLTSRLAELRDGE